jgi:CheY-like chemotaxis protein
VPAIPDGLSRAFPECILVLVVDDAPPIRRLMRLLLETCGHGVLESADGVVGMRLMLAEPPDLVLIDVAMPGPSGVDMLRAARADRDLARVPMIILTARAWPRRRLRRWGPGRPASWPSRSAWRG